jgi:DedD protein
MEKNRILWVMLSAAFFLVVVLAGGLFFLKPLAEEEIAIDTGVAGVGRDFDVFEYVRGKSELPGLEEKDEEPQEMVIVVGEVEESGVMQMEAEAKEETLVIKEKQPEKEAPSRIVRPTVVKVAKPAEVKPRKVKVKEYWIQTGSYSSHSRAEDMAAMLTNQGLSGRVTTREVDGRTFFRVRIGPYAEKAEAEKFLSWVHDVKGLETSYISLVYARRYIP